MMIADMHCDTVSVLLEKRRKGEKVSLRENTGHLDLLRMKQGGYLLQNFALYVNKQRCEDSWEEVCALYRIYQKEMEENKDIITPVFNYRDIAENISQGKISAMLTVEEGAVCRGELEKLHRLYDMGVRMLTLTWNFPNELGVPHGYKEGLTGQGRQFVAEMEQMGMIVDVSHLSDAGFYDVLECTSKPFVASHSNAREICGHSRNLTDHMLRKLGERGGCTGLNYYVNFLDDNGNGDMEAMVRHARHIVNVGGIEVLGLGSDFDGIDTNEALPGAESMECLWNALHRAGFAESDLDKIFYKNVLRVYEDVLL